MSKYYYTDITPAGWTFSIWLVIYAWQGLWLVYGLSTTCRKTSYGYLYITPGHQPPALYITFIFNMATNIAWLFMWDRFLPQYALIFLPLNAMSLYVCIGISGTSLYHSSPVLIRENMKSEIWVTRILTQNGLALYAAWSSIASILNLDVVLINFAHLKTPVAGTISLAIIFLLVVVWFFTDNFVFDRFLRYIVTPYPVFIVALIGSIWNNWDATSSNSILAGCILAVSIIAFISKLILLVWKHKKNPLFSDGGPTFYTQQVSYGALGDEKEYDSLMD